MEGSISIGNCNVELFFQVILGRKYIKFIEKKRCM